jgi:hypothetical protein
MTLLHFSKTSPTPFIDYEQSPRNSGLPLIHVPTYELPKVMTSPTTSGTVRLACLLFSAHANSLILHS